MSDLIRSFDENLKSFIKTQMEPRDWKSDDWETLLEITIKAKAKTSL